MTVRQKRLLVVFVALIVLIGTGNLLITLMAAGCCHWALKA